MAYGARMRIATEVAPESRQKRYRARLQALKNERSSWDAHWKEIADYILPRRVRFHTTEANQGTKKNTLIINGRPTKAMRILAAGMMGGITSPSRPWFRLTTGEPELAEVPAVRHWLFGVESRIRETYSKSNIYRALAQMYLGIGSFGTHAFLVEEDQEDIIRAYELPIGSYYLAQSPRRAIDTVYRELRMTTDQVVREFGLDVCSQTVKDNYERRKLDTWVDLVHLIEPNDAVEPSRADSRGMPWRSCWFEARQQEGQEKYLREAGYREFPLMAPRWEVTGEDIYGSSPAMDCLGDCKALQLLEKRKAQALEKIVSPPMRGPAALRFGRASILPGDTTYLDAAPATGTYEPAMTVDPRAYQFAGAEIRELENRIDQHFLVDLFLMLANSDDRNMTATEVAERHEEKMLQLGPVLEGLGDEVFDPLIDRTFEILLRRGLIAAPPKELQGQDLKVEYVSILHAAQKAVGKVAVDQLVTGVIGMAQAVPSVLDKLDTDEVVDHLADILGVPPKLVRDDESVASLREAQAQEKQAAQAQEAGLAVTEGAKNLAQTQLEGDNAMSRILQQFPAAAGGGVPTA